MQTHPACFTCKSAGGKTTMILFLNKFSPKNMSVHRFTNIFNNSVELPWLISVHVMGGFIYQLHRGADRSSQQECTAKLILIVLT